MKTFSKNTYYKYLVISVTRKTSLNSLKSQSLKCYYFLVKLVTRWMNICDISTQV